MSGRLSSADHIIMARRTITGIYAHVVERRISKTRDVMTHGAIRSGWHVVNEFTDTDYIVVAGFTVTKDTGVIIDASAKRARRMANTTVFIGRHVVERFTARINTVAGSAVVHDVRMIDECTREALSVMAGATIVSGRRVGGHSRCFSGRVNTIAFVVA